MIIIHCAGLAEKTTSWCRLWDTALDRGVQGPDTPEGTQPKNQQGLNVTPVESL